MAVFGDYMPWGVHKSMGGDRSTYPKHSGLILDLKEARPSAVEHFRAMIEPELPENIAIAVVPSHDPAKPGMGLKLLAAALCTSGGRIDATECLVRTKKTDKRAHGGDRSEDVHLGSIVAVRAELIQHTQVLIIDDVSKTGNSLSACRKLMLESGASVVQCAAIGIV
jgi:predicted amidophosphoribosyltransferase